MASCARSIVHEKGNFLHCQRVECGTQKDVVLDGRASFAMTVKYDYDREYLCNKAALVRRWQIWKLSVNRQFRDMGKRKVAVARKRISKVKKIKKIFFKGLTEKIKLPN